MADRRRLGLVAGALCAALVVTGCASAGEPDQDSLVGSTLGDPYEAPDVALTSTDGAAYSLAAQTEKPLTLVFFGYTECPDICTMVMANIASAMTRLDDDERGKVDVVFVTTDPARDDQDTLRAYLDRFDPGFVGLTGRMPQILEVGQGFHVAIERGHKLPTGGYDVTHGTQVFAVDEGDEVPIFWRQDVSPAQLAADVSRLLEGEA